MSLFKTIKQYKNASKSHCLCCVAMQPFYWKPLHNIIVYRLYNIAISSASDSKTAFILSLWQYLYNNNNPPWGNIGNTGYSNNSNKETPLMVNQYYQAWCTRNLYLRSSLSHFSSNNLGELQNLMFQFLQRWLIVFTLDICSNQQIRNPYFVYRLTIKGEDECLSKNPTLNYKSLILFKLKVWNLLVMMYIQM